MEHSKYHEPTIDYKVLVETCTYNQAQFITDTLKGVAMQKTNFPFVHYVIDDASTDGEQNVIKDWINTNCVMSRAEILDTPTVHIILAPHLTNKNCSFAIYLLKDNLFKNQKEKNKYSNPWRKKAQYIALCEGDDYWSLPEKLQMQVDILDKDDKVGLVYSKDQHWIEDTQTFSEIVGCQQSFKDILVGSHLIPTPSTVYRSRLYFDFFEKVQYENKDWKMFDFPLNLYISGVSSIKCLDSVTCIHRILLNSASHNSEELKLLPYYRSIFEIRLFFYDYFNVDNMNILDSIFRNELRFLYKLSLRVGYDNVKESIVETYNNKPNHSLKDRIIYNIISNKKCPLFAKWLFLLV